MTLEELAIENAELKAYNEKLLDGDIEKHNKIVELQAEVISLKNKCRQYENGYAYEKLYELRVQVENELDEAKEIIKKFSEFVNNEVEYDPEHPQEHTDLWNKLCERAEDFLKEN